MSSAGNDVVDAWYRAQDGEVRGKVDALLEHLGNRKRDDWRRPQFDLLSGNTCKGLGEVRAKTRGGQYRLLGYFGPHQMTFTVLACFKKTRKNDTNPACELSQKRRKEVASDVSRARQCSFP
jgi:hypothetical protein